MEKITGAAQKIMEERLGHDSLIALATAENGMPSVRTVNSFYENCAFYVIPYALSGKMKQIERNPAVAVCGEWFTAHGIGESLGYLRDPKNGVIAAKLRTTFKEWYDNGHVDENDLNTCILRIRLTDGVLFSQGTRYDMDFSAE